MGSSTTTTRAHTSVIAATGFAYPSEVVDNAQYMERCRFDLADPEGSLIRVGDLANPLYGRGRPQAVAGGQRRSESA